MAYRAWLWLRSALFWVWSILLTLAIGGPVLIAALISFDLGYRLINIWLYGNLYGLKLICGLSWEVDGRENIPDTPCLVLAKHQSTWETYFLPSMLPRAVYVAKRSLVLIPIFGWALYAMRFILIDRASGRSAIRQMVEQARERLAERRWIIIFPEGTRRPVGAAPAYRIGGAVVAEETGANILPIAIDSGSYWPRMGFIKYPGTIRVSVLPPISPAGRDAATLLAEVEAVIETRMASFPPGPVRPAA